MPPRITIQNVAELANVSTVTVSYVLNGRSAAARISEDTRLRVLDAAKQLGYRRNAIGRMLATQRSDTIAVVFQYAKYFSSWSSFTSDVMHGVCLAAVEADYDLMLHTRASDSAQGEADQLTDGRVDGALVLRDSDDSLIDILIERQLPTVLFFTRSTNPESAFVDADNYAGGRMATRHLLELGHRRVGIVIGSAASVSSNDRFNGYRDALEGYGIHVDPQYMVTIESPDADMSGFIEMMKAPERPTALFVWSDDVAFQCMKLLRELGLNVPSDVSVVGFDSLEACNQSSPPLTSIRQPICDMAKDATELLISLIRAEKPKRTQLVYPLTLDIRGSTQPFSNLT